MKKLTLSAFCILVAGILTLSAQKYQPTFESLEKVNPVPEWFKDAKFGIYFHWGVYSVPAFSNEWYPREMYFEGNNVNKHHIETFGDIDKFPYDKFISGTTDKQGKEYKFAPKLKSEGGQFDPAEWAQLFADAGAKFAGPVAEHHDGFSMWASSVNPWNAKDMGPKLDLVGQLTQEIRKHDMKVILSMHHAFNITGFYEKVPANSDPKLQILYGQQGKEKNEALWLAKHKEIIDNYQPDIIWQDFNLSAISNNVLLQFLAYYYNSAEKLNKSVVATYKDALNTKCAVLDYERGGPTELTQNYWLTDDAISSSSWCYTEGIGYYSLKQVFHGFLDRVSKNGNLLLNISPKADGSIPQEQKEILLGMGNWLKKYGEAIYATRAWEKYGEGPTKMGAAHGVFENPKEGTSKDIRYTRSKDNTILYAIMLGWDKGQKEILLKSLNPERINLKKLKKVELINGAAGKYLKLKFKQNAEGLLVQLPEKSLDELAYVLRLSFDGSIPPLDNYADMNTSLLYYLGFQGRPMPVLGADGTLHKDKKNPSQQWRLEKTGKGICKIINMEDQTKLLTASESGVTLEKANGTKNQLWKFENTFNGLLKISNSTVQGKFLTIQDNKAVLSPDNDSSTGWQLFEVCQTKQTVFKPLVIPGTIEAEDFDNGCPGEAWYDKSEQNEGKVYRTDAGVDIEVCKAGGYNIGWVNTGEWINYSLDVAEAGDYKAVVYVATNSDLGAFHLEFNGKDKTGIIKTPNTGGYQNWKTVEFTLTLEKGPQVMLLYMDNAVSGLNIDKIVFIK